MEKRKELNMKDLQDTFYNKLKDEKIKINWNKKPIRMDLFLSLLTCKLVRSTDHLGLNNGWTQLNNTELNLSIKGGYVDGVEYLDSIQFGNKLSNKYNNYVNPFYLFEIMTKEGQDFFIDYYKEDINKLSAIYADEIIDLESCLKRKKKHFCILSEEIEYLTPPPKKKLKTKLKL